MRGEELNGKIKVTIQMLLSEFLSCYKLNYFKRIIALCCCRV